jgi:serine/threonine protein kinase/WD40 repeat protein
MAGTGTHPSPELLTSFSEGKLSQTEAAAIKAHLESCLDCRRVLAGTKARSSESRASVARPDATRLPSATQLPKAKAAPPPPAEPAAQRKSPASVPDVPAELADHPKFKIIRELGRGGMGVIYLAEHRVMEKAVALKVISPAVLDNPEALSRFLAEVKAAGKLDHKNIARAYDADQAGDLHFLVMEFVEGMSLAEILEKTGPLSIASACHCTCQAAMGLQHAFEQGMAHRDIKPQNLMLTPRGQIKVLDFGLARVRGQQKGKPGLTQADAFMGTPEYVAPEQATDARSADIRADIYSLGCTLYALLTGRTPFVEDTAVKLILAHIEQEPPPLDELRPDVPKELSAIVAKILAKDPTQRYQQPIEVAKTLAPFAKEGSKLAAAPPATSSDGGTRIGGSTSRMKAPGAATPKPPTKGVAAPIEPLNLMADEPASAAVPRKTKRVRKQETPTTVPVWKRPVVLASAPAAALLTAVAVLWAAGVFKAKPQEGILSLENLPANALVLLDGKLTKNRLNDETLFEVGVEPGKKHRLEIRKAGFMTVGQDFEVESGVRKWVMVRLQPNERPREGPEATESPLKPKTAELAPARLKQPDFAKLPSRPAAETGLSRLAFLWANPGTPPTSNEFVIRKPFLNFRIGGVCINLIVDNQIVRTATGSDNERLVWHHWDVSNLRGKKAIIQLRIKNGARRSWLDQVSIDDIQFAEVPRGPLKSETPDLLLAEVRQWSERQTAMGPVIFSPDSKFLLCGGDNGMACIYDIASGKTVAQATQPGQISSVAFSRNGDKVLLGSAATAELRLWDWKTDSVKKQYSYPSAQLVPAVAFAKDSSRFLCCTTPEESLASERLHGHRNKMAATPSTAVDEIVRIYDPAIEKPIHKMAAKAHWQQGQLNNPVTCAVFSPDAKEIYFGMAAGTIRELSVRTGQDVRRFNGHRRAVHSLAPSTSGRFLLSGGDDRVLRLWDVVQRKEKLIFHGHNQAVRAVALSQDGRLALSGGDDKTVRLWDAGTGEELIRWEGHTAPVNGVAFSPDGKYAASASADKTVRLWELPKAPASQPQMKVGR